MIKLNRLVLAVAFVSLALIAAANLRAQGLSELMHFATERTQDYTGIAAGAGLTVIDGEPYFLFHLAPQFEIGKFGFGFDGNVRLSTKGKLRKEDFDETYDFLRLINYVQYGHIRDTIFARIGGLSRITLGNGTIINNYSNNSSYDDRRIGLAGRADLSYFGAEAMTSDIARKGIVGVRPFIRPFQFTPLSDTWLLSGVTVGASSVFDMDTSAGRIIPNRYPYVRHIKTADGGDSLLIDQYNTISTPLTFYGADITIPLLDGQNIALKVYTDYVKIKDFNEGIVFGAHSSFALGKDILFDLTLERSLYKNHFLPNYFNSFYERDRFDNQADSIGYITKATLLSDTTGGNGNGFRAGGFLSLLGAGQVIMSYTHLDNLTGHDVLEAYLNIPSIWAGFFGSVAYSRKEIDGVGDIFKLDKKSILNARLTLPIVDFLYGSLIVRETFDRDENGRLVTQTFFEPRADVIIRL